MYETGDFSEIESDGVEVGNATRIKHDYHDKTWKQDQLTYDPKPQEFLGVLESIIMWQCFPTMM
jgi:hypothetical protein